MKKETYLKKYKTVQEFIDDMKVEDNKWYNKYCWLPLYRYFLNPVLFNPLGWLKMLPRNIRFRIKHKCPYRDTWSLDYTFYRFMYPRLKYIVTYCLENYVLTKDEKRDYRRMLKLSDILHNVDFCFATKKSEYKKHEEFMDLLKKHMNRLWT